MFCLIIFLIFWCYLKGLCRCSNSNKEFYKIQYELQSLKSALDHHERQLIYIFGPDIINKYENNSNQVYPHKKIKNYNFLMLRNKISMAKRKPKSKKSASAIPDLSNIDPDLSN